MSIRLDQALAERGLARSRTHAQTQIQAGLVSVDGRAVVKPSVRVEADARIEVAASDHYVSRAAHKLLSALDAWPIAVDGRIALDLGASTGGFTQVLRERGADPVIAVDVGHGQLDASIAADAHVISIEGLNARYLSPESLAEASGVTQAPGLIVGDLSFISLGHVLPAIAALLAENGDVVMLVKPQFEVGRTAVKGGLVTDPALRSDAVMGVLWEAWDAGLATRAVAPSPIVGTHGNREFLAWFVPRASGAASDDPGQWRERVDEFARA